MIPCNPNKERIDPRLYIDERGPEALASRLLETAKYAVPRTLLNDFCESLCSRKPLLIIGERGSGKSAFAKALAEAFNLNLFQHVCRRSQSNGTFLYAWRTDFQKLVLETLYREGRDLEATLEELHGRRFLELGEILAAYDEAATNRIPPVLYLDEFDKASDTEEDDLLEILDTGMVHIPNLKERFIGTEDSSKRPVVIICANETRKAISEPVLSRCVTSYLDSVPFDKQIEIMISKVRIPMPLTMQIVRLFYWMDKDHLIKSKPNVRELLDFAGALKRKECRGIDREVLGRHAALIAKPKADRNYFLKNLDHFALKAQTPVEQYETLLEAA